MRTLTLKSKVNDAKYLFDKRQVGLLTSIINDVYNTKVYELVDILKTRSDKKSKVMLNNILHEIDKNKER